VNVGQQFEISATIANSGDEGLEGIIVRLGSDGESSYPESLLVESLDVDADTTVSFQISAPLNATAKSSELFIVTLAGATGSVSGLPARILAPGDNTQLTVIQTPANLSLALDIKSPLEAQDGVVKPATEFVIFASVANVGQAATGDGELRLELSDSDFAIADAPTQSFAVGDEIVWTVRAPDFPDTCLLTVIISRIPEDLNVQAPAKTITTEQELTVLVREIEVEIGVDFTASGSSLLNTGQTYRVIDLSFDVIGADEQPYLREVSFDLLDRSERELDPATLLAAAELNYNSDYDIAGQFDATSVRFPLEPEYDLPDNASISLTLLDDPAHNDFTIHLDSNSFIGEYMTPAGIKQVPIRARFSSRLLIEQGYTLVPPALESSFFCYPNPFSPHRQVLKFSDPRPDKAKTLTIFSLAGDQVYTTHLEPGAVDQLTWDGRTGGGQMVLNGVYLAILSIDGVGEARTKIAVVK
jgi:hypothetical protein